VADNKVPQVHPNKVPWYWRMLGMHKRQFHNAALALDQEGSEDCEALTGYMDKLLNMGQERRERYKTFVVMDTFDIVSAILDLYSEECTQRDYERGRSVWVESKNTKMVTAGTEALSNLQMEDRVTHIARGVAKMGDKFMRMLYATGKGVLGWRGVDPACVHRIEDKYSRLIGFRQDGQKFRGGLKRNVSWPWDYVHFRLHGKYDKDDNKYGSSMLESMYRPWRQLVMAEDSVLMYRLRRTPDRNMILVDVGNMEEAEAQQFLNKWRKRFRKYEFIDPASPNYKKQYNPLTPLEDIFVAMRRDNQTRIETLSGAGNVGELYDLEHYRNKLFGVARVPKAYFGYEGEINAKATLTQQDVRFARGCKRLQRAVIYGVRQALEIHYTLLPESPEDTSFDFNMKQNEFIVQMSPISYLDEWERLELVQLRYQIVDAMSNLAQSLQLDPKVWSVYVLLNYAKLPEELVQKLIAKEATPAPPLPMEALPPRMRQHLLAMPAEQRQELMEATGTQGYYTFSRGEERAVAEAVHNSPALRRAIANIRYFHEDDIHEIAVQQVDSSIIPVTVRGQPLMDDYTDDPEAKILNEDMQSVQNSVTEDTRPEGEPVEEVAPVE